MNRSISIVDYKVNQADFFLERFSEAKFDFFAAQCYCDAFVSAARGITFSIQAVCSRIEGFDRWYSVKQSNLRESKLARFFHNYRTISNHIGDTPLQAGVMIDGKCKFHFTASSDLKDVPTNDAVEVCKEYFNDILTIVYELYTEFRFAIDDRWFYTMENFANLGRTIEDAEEDLGYPRGWTEVSGSEIEMADRWRTLRYCHTSGPEFQDVLFRRLNIRVSGPDDDYVPPKSEKSGWIFPPSEEEIR